MLFRSRKHTTATDNPLGLYISESPNSSILPTRATDWLEEQDRLPVNVKRDTIERRIRLLEQAKTAYDAEDTVQLQEILEQQTDE